MVNLVINAQIHTTYFFLLYLIFPFNALFKQPSENSPLKIDKCYLKGKMFRVIILFAVHVVKVSIYA